MSVLATAAFRPVTPEVKCVKKIVEKLQKCSIYIKVKNKKIKQQKKHCLIFIFFSLIHILVAIKAGYIFTHAMLLGGRPLYYPSPLAFAPSFILFCDLNIILLILLVQRVLAQFI